MRPSGSSTANLIARAIVYGALGGAAIGVVRVPDHFTEDGIYEYVIGYLLFGVIVTLAVVAVVRLGGGPK